MSRTVEDTEPRPAPRSALLALARQAADAGAYERVSELYAAARQQGACEEELGRWRRLLLEAGDFAAAREAGWEGEPRLEPEAGAAAETGDEEGDLLDFEPGPREPVEPAVPEATLDAFLKWFGGRAGVYARQWYDARRDRTGYWPVREPLSRSVVAAHVLGRLTAGQYVLHPDDTVSFAAVDFDPTAEALEELRLEGGVEGGLGLPAMVDYAGRVRRAAEALGLSPFLEDTGGAGLHLWFFFAPRIAAGRARGLLRELLWRTGAQPPAVAVEIFPKQDRLAGKSLGNLIKLPLGVHQATLRRSRFLGSGMEPMPDTAALASLRASDPAAIDEIVARRVVPLVPGSEDARPPAETPEVSPPPPPPSGASPKALAQALAAIASGRESARAADRILQGCSTVRQLARKAEEERRLSANEARALLYTVGLAGREASRIEDFFAQAGISRKELERVRRGLQGPMGCRRLRELFPDSCRRCACPAPEKGGYATPALFALRRPVNSPRRALVAPLPADVAADPSDLSLPELHQRLARIEALLRSLRPEHGDE